MIDVIEIFADPGLGRLALRINDLISQCYRVKQGT